MTRVLIIDGNQETRLALETRVSESSQFERVLSCSNLMQADLLVAQYDIKVILIEAGQANDSGTLEKLQTSYPGVGLVLIQEDADLLDPASLRQLGVHAQTSRMATPMEFVSCIAKALVARLRPGKVLLGKLFPGSK